MAALAAILLPSFLHAQITFERTYGHPGLVEGGNSVQQTTDGGYVVAGYTGPYAADSDDVLVIRTDAYGDTLWTRTYDGTGNDSGNSIQQTADGGYVIVGRVERAGRSDCDVWLIKTFANGDTMFTRTFGGASDDVGYSVQQTTDSGFIIAGYTQSFGAGGSDVYLVRTDANGDTVWTGTFGSSADDVGRCVEQTADGGYAIAGEAGPGHHALLIKTDTHGDTQWTRAYGGSGYTAGYSVDQTSDGGYAVAGCFATPEFVYLIKTGANGDTTWTKTFGEGSLNYGYDARATADSGYIVTGLTWNNYTDVCLIRTNGRGDTLWTKVFGSLGYDEGHSVQQTADGGYIMVGASTSSGHSQGYVYLVKTDPWGRLAVAEPRTSPTRASALSLTCEPNPCRGTTRISFTPQASSSRPLTLRMYDSQGRMVLSREVPTSPFLLSTSDLPSGVYIIRCDAAGEHASTRVVLQH
jgi:hypothetical protein